MPFPLRFGPWWLDGVLAGGQSSLLLSARPEQNPEGEGGVVKIPYLFLQRTPGYKQVFQERLQQFTAARHPGLVPVRSAGRSAGLVWAAMPRVVGLDGAAVLRAMARQGRRPSLRQVLTLGLELAEVLGGVHSVAVDGSPLVHGELRPSKVIFTPDGHARLLLSSAVTAASADRASSNVAERFAWRAPEQLLRQPESVRTDLRGLALLLFVFATGSNPFLRRTTARTCSAILQDQVLFEGDSALSAELSVLLRGAMSSDPDRRPVSVAAFSAGLKTELSRLGGEEPWIRWLRKLGEAPAEVPDERGLQEQDALLARLARDAPRAAGSVPENGSAGPSLSQEAFPEAQPGGLGAEGPAFEVSGFTLVDEVTGQARAQRPAAPPHPPRPLPDRPSLLPEADTPSRSSPSGVYEAHADPSYVFAGEVTRDQGHVVREPLSRVELAGELFFREPSDPESFIPALSAEEILPDLTTERAWTDDEATEEVPVVTASLGNEGAMVNVGIVDPGPAALPVGVAEVPPLPQTPLPRPISSIPPDAVATLAAPTVQAEGDAWMVESTLPMKMVELVRTAPEASRVPEPAHVAPTPHPPALPTPLVTPMAQPAASNGLSAQAAAQALPPPPPPPPRPNLLTPEPDPGPPVRSQVPIEMVIRPQPEEVDTPAELTLDQEGGSALRYLGYGALLAAGAALIAVLLSEGALSPTAAAPGSAAVASAGLPPQAAPEPAAPEPAAPEPGAPELAVARTVPDPAAPALTAAPAAAGRGEERAIQLPVEVPRSAVVVPEPAPVAAIVPAGAAETAARPSAAVSTTRGTGSRGRASAGAAAVASPGRPGLVSLSPVVSASRVRLVGSVRGWFNRPRQGVIRGGGAGGTDQFRFEFQGIESLLATGEVGVASDLVTGVRVETAPGKMEIVIDAQAGILPEFARTDSGFYIQFVKPPS